MHPASQVLKGFKEASGLQKRSTIKNDQKQSTDKQETIIYSFIHTHHIVKKITPAANDWGIVAFLAKPESTIPLRDAVW